jgi:hypothetical protein
MGFKLSDLIKVSKEEPALKEIEFSCFSATSKPIVLE